MSRRLLIRSFPLRLGVEPPLQPLATRWYSSQPQTRQVEAEEEDELVPLPSPRRPAILQSGPFSSRISASSQPLLESPFWESSLIRQVVDSTLKSMSLPAPPASLQAPRQGEPLSAAKSKEEAENEAKIGLPPKFAPPLSEIVSNAEAAAAFRRRRSRPKAQSNCPPAPEYFPAQIQKLPETEAEFWQLLRFLARRPKPVETSWLVSFAFVENNLRFLSPRICAFLLHLAFLKDSNLALGNEILAEMERREMKIQRMDSRVIRVLLSSAVRRGDGQNVSKYTSELKRLGTTPFAAVNWRRDFGQIGKGSGDENFVWKGKKAAKAGQAGEQPIGIIPTQPRRQRELISAAANSLRTFSAKESLFARGRTRIPANFAQLANEDISTLVESLVQDFNFDEASRVAEVWLNANRPLGSVENLDECSSETRPIVYNWATAQRYSTTAIVLLDILLKPLFINRFSPAQLRQFVHSFLARHSIKGKRKLWPDARILRTLISGCLQKPSAWYTAMKLVDWFGLTFGLPVSRSNGTYMRKFFPKPNKLDAQTTLSEISSEVQQIASRPRDYVDGTVAKLLLNLATQENPPARDRGALRHAVTKWWTNLLESQHAKADSRFLTREMKFVVLRAKRKGILGNYHEHKLWLQKRERRLQRSAEKGKAETRRKRAIA